MIAVRMTEVLARLVAGLEPLLAPDPRGAGLALGCPAHGLFHNRAGEAAWPLVFLGLTQDDPARVETGLKLADWLVSRQDPDGSWPETPSDWRGTTVFQLLALAAILDRARDRLTPERAARYFRAAGEAAQWISGHVSLRRTTTNYVASAAAGLALLGRITSSLEWTRAARKLAGQAAGRINTEGLIQGEGLGRRYLRKIYFKPQGIDIGYGLEMTLAALALAARLLADEGLAEAVGRAVRAHLGFIYPDGSLDNSLGSRGYKWTVYGSKTAHGGQMALGFSAARGDGQARRALALTTDYLGQCLRQGLLSTGPDWRAAEDPACIYPTLLRAANLAFALAYFPDLEGSESPLPAEAGTWLREWKTLGSLQVRTSPWLATVSGYGYRTVFPRSEEPLIHWVPAGGALTYLFLEGWGPVQAATPLEYHVFEPLHVPEVTPQPASLCPRAEAVFDAGPTSTALARRVRLKGQEEGRTVTVSAEGRFGGFGLSPADPPARFSITYLFAPDRLVKTYRLFLDKPARELRIVEPIIAAPETRIEPSADGAVLVRDGRRLGLAFQAQSGQMAAADQSRPWTCPLPALAAWPLVWTWGEVEAGVYTASLEFRPGEGLKGAVS